MDWRVTADGGRTAADAAYWMRFYFRHARSVERRLKQMLEDAPKSGRRPGCWGFDAERKLELQSMAFAWSAAEWCWMTHRGGGRDPAHDPDVVLKVFAAIARTGSTLGRDAEERMSQALPLLSAQPGGGTGAVAALQEILTGSMREIALRAMHALGILELLIPEFHGIDALVIRDAYHRYTVDEHTFVLIDTLHGLEDAQTGAKAEWASRFGALLRELPHPGAACIWWRCCMTPARAEHGRPCARECADGAERAGAAGAGTL